MIKSCTKNHTRSRLLAIGVILVLAATGLLVLRSYYPSIKNSLLADKESSAVRDAESLVQGSTIDALANTVLELRSSMESYETKIKTLQQRLDRLDSSNSSKLELSADSRMDPIKHTYAVLTKDPKLPEEASEAIANHDPHPVTPLLQNSANTKVLYYLIGSPGKKAILGFGSLLNNLLFISSYLRMTQGRKLVVDETDLSLYRKDSTHGMLAGYFDTKFPIVSSKQEYQQFIQEANVSIDDLPLYKTGKSHADKPILKVVTHDCCNGTFPSARNEARASFYDSLGCKAPTERKVHQFYLLSLELCQSMKINAATQGSIDGILKEASIPDFAGLQSRYKASRRLEDVPPPPPPRSNQPITVAIHVRRGDKIEEVGNTAGERYVGKLHQVLKANNIQTKEELAAVQHCFVATDDYDAFLEVQTAMANSYMVPHCKLHTLASANSNSHPRDGSDFAILLAELKMMVDATFFIGTFSSNLGSLVALFHGCNHPAVKGKALPLVGHEYDVLSEEQVAN